MAYCFLCDSEMAPRFHTRDHLRPNVLTEYTIEWCAPCDFGRVAGKFQPGDVASFYTSEYYTHDALVESGKRQTSLLDRLLVQLAWRVDRGMDLSPSEVKPAFPGSTMCDVGCGSGRAMAMFKRAGYDVIGIEPDADARLPASKAGEVIDGTAETLDAALAGRHFDVILLSHVLEHCIDPTAALVNVKKFLVPGGTTIIEVPNNTAKGFEMYGPSWFFSDVPRHLNFFTEASLRRALALVGLRVTRVIYTGYARQFSASWLAAQRAIRTNTGLDAGQAWAGNIGLHLATTAFARPARKYDSIRIHAIRES